MPETMGIFFVHGQWARMTGGQATAQTQILEDCTGEGQPSVDSTVIQSKFFSRSWRKHSSISLSRTKHVTKEAGGIPVQGFDLCLVPRGGRHCSKMSLIFIRLLVFIRGEGIQPGKLGINEGSV